MKTIHVGIIGAGFIGLQHIEAVRRIPGTEVVALASPNAQKVQEICDQWFIPGRYQTHQELLAHPGLDIVHICTPSASHYIICKDALLAGKHICCEKPLTLTSDEARELEVLAAKTGVGTAVNLNYRHNSIVKEMKERIQQDKFGRIFEAHAEYLQDWLLYPTDYDWRLNPAMGGESRAVSDIGSHCFDTLQYVLGKKIVSVFAQMTTIFPTRKRCEGSGTFSAGTGKVIEELPVQSEDLASILLRFEDGTPGYVHVSQVCAGKKNGFSLYVSGEETSLDWHQEQPDRLLVGHRDTPNEEVYADPKLLSPFAARYASLPGGHAAGWHDAFRNAIASFYESIRKGAGHQSDNTDYANFTDGRYIMQIIEACVKSKHSGQWENVE